MAIWEPPKRRSRLRLVSVDGNPTDAERETLQEAVERLAAAERHARAPSLWLRVGRARARRLDMYDYRDRAPEGDAWRLSLRWRAGGREHAGRVGRGDAK